MYCFLLIVIVFLQGRTVALQSSNVEVEKPVIAQDNRKCAGELCNTKRVDGNVLVIHDQHDEYRRPDEDMKRIEYHFEFDEAENLPDE